MLSAAARRDVIEIIGRVRPWAGPVRDAFVWYRTVPLPSFGGRTAAALVNEGRADAVRRYLDRIAAGGHA